MYNTYICVCVCIRQIGYLGFNIVLSLALRASWSFDALIAVVVARYATIGATRVAVWVDAFMP